MDPLEQGHDLVPDQPAQRRVVRRVGPPLEATLAAERLRLLTPDAQQRSHDTVVAADANAARRAPAREAEEDRLHLIRERMPRRAQLARAERIAHVPQLGLRRTASRGLHDLGVEPLRAPRGIGIRLGAATAVVDVQSGDAVPELAERMEEARRVGAPGDEAEDLAAGLDQLVAADVALDPLEDLQGVIEPRTGGRRTSQRLPAPPSAGPTTRSPPAAGASEEHAPILEGLPHAERLVERDRRHVVGAHEERDERRRLEQ